MNAESVLCYRFPGAERTLQVLLAAPELLPLINSFYPNYRRTPGSGGAGAAPTIALWRENGAYRLSGPSGDWSVAGAGEALLYYESELTGALLDDAGAFVHLHGAAACDKNGCLLLVGPSGAGKSTLTLGLRLRGMDTLADDALLIDPASGRVAPFDRSIRVHIAGLTELGVPPEAVPGARYCEPYLWLNPRDRMTEFDSTPPAALVFLERSATAALEELGAAETLRQLLVARLGDVPRRDFECLCRLATQVPGYRLAYRGLREALGALQRLSGVELAD